MALTIALLQTLTTLIASELDLVRIVNDKISYCGQQLRPATASLHVLMCRAKPSQLENEVARLHRVVKARDRGITWHTERGKRLGENLMTTERDVHELACQLAQAAKFGAQPKRQGLNVSKPLEVSTATCFSSPHLNLALLVQQAVNALRCIHKKDVMT